MTTSIETASAKWFSLLFAALLFSAHAAFAVEPITVTWDEIEQEILDNADISVMMDNPRENVHQHMSHFALIDVFGDRGVIDGKPTPLMNVEFAMRARFEATVYGIFSLKLRPEVRDGKLSLVLHKAEAVDVRENNGVWGQIFDVDIASYIRNIMRGKFEANAGRMASTELEKLNEQLAGASLMISEVRVDGKGLRIIPAMPPIEPKIVDNLTNKDLNFRGINASTGKAEEAALIVHVYLDHLNYVMAALNYRWKKGWPPAHDWEVFNGHGDLDRWLRHNGLRDINRERDEPGRPGINVITLYLKSGDNWPDLRDDRGFGGWNWNDKIGSVQVRPGPLYRGETIQMFDHLEFGDNGENHVFGVGDHCLKMDAGGKLWRRVSSFRVND